MLDQAIRDKYVVVIGLEVHAQLLTKSKIFSAEATDYGVPPNTNIGPITLGHPGTLPKLNRTAVEYAIRMGLACESKITRENIFARKNYFYPDLPKGYQITQDKAPICLGGKVWITNATGHKKAILLNRIHLEEDAGKSIHPEGATETLVDYNRAGVPLIEIVTEPCLRSSAEAHAFLTEVRRLVRYLEICDGNMEEGSFRCDANVSVMLQNSPEYGSKVEVKNMNSMRNVQRAIDHEVQRQILRLEAGQAIESETRDFDAHSGLTSSLRSKESLNDYRYFPEPDLCPLIVEQPWIDEIQAGMPSLPQAYQEKFTQVFGLPQYDAEVLTDDKEMAKYFDQLSAYTSDYKMASNWMMGPVKSYLNERSIPIKSLAIVPEKMATIIALVARGMVSMSVAAKEILPDLASGNKENALEIAERKNLIQDTSSASIQPLIDQVLMDFSEKVKAYKGGKRGLIGLFIGEVMKRSKGSPDPKLTKELLEKALE